MLLALITSYLNRSFATAAGERAKGYKSGRPMLWMKLFSETANCGFHPSQIVRSGWLYKLVQQSWEMDEDRLTLIHSHRRNCGISPGFVNTNTGYFGLFIRRALRHDEKFREWIFRTTLDCRQMGCTSVRLKSNPFPTRKAVDCRSPGNE